MVELRQVPAAEDEEGSQEVEVAVVAQAALAVEQAEGVVTAELHEVQVVVAAADGEAGGAVVEQQAALESGLEARGLRACQASPWARQASPWA